MLIRHGRHKYGSSLFWVAVVSEFIGTFIMIFVGLGSSLYGSREMLGISNVNVAASYAMAYCFASLALKGMCSCHFNPATTLCFMFTGEALFLYGVLCISMQILGGLMASCALLMLSPNISTLVDGIAVIPQGGLVLSAVVSEFIGTLLIILPHMRRTNDPASHYMINAIGVFTAVLTFTPYSGGAMNPARAFGPAAVSETFTEYHWIYWVGPFLASVAAVLTDFLLVQNDEKHFGKQGTKLARDRKQSVWSNVND